METPTKPPLAIGDSEEKNLELASSIASVNLLFAQQELGKRIIDPTVTTKTLLDVAEHSYKVSGMQKKQEPKEQGGKFVFNINFSGGKQVHIEKDVTPDAELVEATPANLLVDAASLFDSAPEFS